LSPHFIKIVLLYNLFFSFICVCWFFEGDVLLFVVGVVGGLMSFNALHRYCFLEKETRDEILFLFFFTFEKFNCILQLSFQVYLFLWFW
jgi:hypothetical protein